MPKILYVDSDKLEKKISESGVKIDYICENLGITRQGFIKKRRGITPFKASEVYVLCDILRINTLDEKEKIFTEKVE